MRYTLRLLTLDQLGRGAALISAMELEHKNDVEKLGKWPFEIGLWVGQAATPNRMGKSGERDENTARARTRSTSSRYTSSTRSRSARLQHSNVLPATSLAKRETAGLSQPMRTPSPTTPAQSSRCSALSPANRAPVTCRSPAPRRGCRSRTPPPTR